MPRRRRPCPRCRTATIDGDRSYCLVCAADKAREWRAAGKDPTDACDLCGGPGVVMRGGVIRRLAQDHDHATGVQRGRLCHSCNLLLGHGHDDPALLRAAADYLERWR